MARLITQKVYDSTAGYVYYTKSFIDPTPGSTETEPNHTDNLVAGTHQIVSDKEAPIERLYEMRDDFVRGSLDTAWDTSGSVNGTVTVLQSDQAGADLGMGNVELVSGPTGGDLAEMLWGTVVTEGGFVAGGSAPVFRARVNVILGTLADFTPEIGLLNVGVSWFCYLNKVGSNWQLIAGSPLGGGGGAAVDTGVAIGGAQNITIAVKPAAEIRVDIDGTALIYNADPTNIGRGIERARPYARITRDANTGGTMVVDYMSVEGTRPA